MDRLSTASSSADSPVAVVFCVRNEKFRLEYFLNYYRELGINEFYAVDNGSNDGSLEYLLEQNDVNLFSTTDSYKSSNAGRDWTSKICREYLQDRWCLTLDVDEFFIYPLMEFIPLDSLIRYLEANSFDGVASLFLDFYSDRPLSETIYEPGQSPFQVCEYFDCAEQYFGYADENFPFFEIKGGPRQRTFWDEQDLPSGPSMRKMVLVKWKPSFAYLVAAHSCTPIRLADFTSAVAHFKFLAHFKEFAQQEVQRNERVSNSKDWRVYAASLQKEDVNFFSSSVSRRYEHSGSLIEQRLVASSPRYVEFARNEKRLKKSNSQVGIDLEKTASAQQPTVQFDQLLLSWSSYSLLSKQMQADTAKLQEVAQIEHKLDNAVNSRIWRATYRLRKLASKVGLTDQRSLTEENYLNQNLASRFTFVYDSIWWDLLGPLRAVVKLLRRLGVLKYRR